MSGCSGTPLAKKLGLKAGHSVALLNAPAGFRATLDGLPADVTFTKRVTSGHDVVHIFTRSKVELVKELPKLRRRIAQDGMIWVSWPKKASKVETDITEDVVRTIALPLGLVDVKVCAVDEVWSGVKLVIRVSERTK